MNRNATRRDAVFNRIPPCDFMFGCFHLARRHFAAGARVGAQALTRIAVRNDPTSPQ